MRFHSNRSESKGITDRLSLSLNREIASFKRDPRSISMNSIKLHIDLVNRANAYIVHDVTVTRCRAILDH